LLVIGKAESRVANNRISNRLESIGMFTITMKSLFTVEGDISGTHPINDGPSLNHWTEFYPAVPWLPDSAILESAIE
jgi:hypothetical protein